MRRSGLVLVAALGLLAGPAGAAQLFHSPGDDGQPAVGPPTIAEGGVRSVFLYVDDGTTSSLPADVCDKGLGDEICGYGFTLTGQGGLTITGFNADLGADLMVNQSSGNIVVNGLDPVSPSAGPKRVGELLVNAVPGGALDLTSGETIGADLGSAALAPGTVVTVPEPAGLGLLGAGVGLLVHLHRRRSAAC